MTYLAHQGFKTMRTAKSIYFFFRRNFGLRSGISDFGTNTSRRASASNFSNPFGRLGFLASMARNYTIWCVKFIADLMRFCMSHALRWLIFNAFASVALAIPPLACAQIAENHWP